MPFGAAQTQTHKLNQLLTLYCQRTWQGSTYGGVSTNGRQLLPALLPTDEIGVYYTTVPHDYTQITPVVAGDYELEADFLAPQIFSDPVRIKGTGYAVIRVSCSVSAGGQWRLLNVNLELRRVFYSLVPPGFTSLKTQDVEPIAAYHDFTSVAETKRSLWFRLEDLDFQIIPPDRLGLMVTSTWRNILGIAGTCRILHKAGEAESYLMLPVVEG